jgi:hypothetical protein
VPFDVLVFRKALDPVEDEVHFGMQLEDPVAKWPVPGPAPGEKDSLDCAPGAPGQIHRK